MKISVPPALLVQSASLPGSVERVSTVLRRTMSRARFAASAAFCASAAFSTMTCATRLALVYT
jgi:hypothetical protein